MQTGVTRFLAAAGVRFVAHAHPPVRNLREARAAGLAFEPHLLTKTLVFRPPQRWLLVWLAALDKIDYGALARAARADRRKIRFADETDLAALGWEAGGAAPVPLAAGAELLVDEAVARLPKAYIGGGRRDLTLEVAPAELLARVAHRQGRLAGR